MAGKQVQPMEPAAPSQAQPAEGPSQDQAQGLADVVAKRVTGIVSDMSRILSALQKMGIPDEQLGQMAQLVDQFGTSVQEALGLGGGEPQEAPEAPEEGNQTVDQMQGNKGVPAV